MLQEILAAFDKNFFITTIMVTATQYISEKRSCKCCWYFSFV